jgi:type III pantothenate kinase
MGEVEVGAARVLQWGMTESELLLISVGNTRTRAAVASGEKLQPSRLLKNDEVQGLEAALLEMAGPEATVLLASVNDPVADKVASMFSGPKAGKDRRLVRVVAPGNRNGLEVPIRCNLGGPITTGVDRLLNALAAHGRSGEACVVIDAGTAVTMDFVDKFGVFQGGCIAPGLGLGLWALHERTAALPVLEPSAVRDAAAGGPLGKTTADAMALGCASAIRGMAHLLVEKYAEVNGAYPRVIATGGDAPLLFEDDEIVEHIVPDLTLMGLQAAWLSAMSVDK